MEQGQVLLTVDARQPPMDRNLFLTKGPYSIALDGFVYGGPWFVEFDSYGNRIGPVLNLNHHEEVDRLATRATCGQTLMALRQGLFQMFRDERGPRATVYVNDCDEDVCLSWFLLHRHYWCEQPLNPLLNRLVAMEDALDATAGAYPYPTDLPALRSMAWIFQPYRSFRVSGEIDKKDSTAYRAVIDSVEHRIESYLVGRGGEVPLTTGFEQIGGGKTWMMVREHGTEARTGMFASGIRAYVSVRERPDGHFTYTVGRMSSFIRFYLPQVFSRLNEVEARAASVKLADLQDRWGGSDTVGGSPRVGGSRIEPDELTKILADL